MPAVDQPSRWVDGRGVDKDVVIPPPIMAWFIAAVLHLLLYFKRRKTNKYKKFIHSLYKCTKLRIKFSKGLTVVRTKEYII
jgi:hypothetical protein